MKLPNGYGGITKLKGNRRKPFMVRVTAGWGLTATGKQKQLYKIIGYFEKRQDALNALSEYNKNPYDLTAKTFAEIYDKWSPRHYEKYPGAKGGLVSAYKKCEPLYKLKITDIKKDHMQSILDAYSHQSEQSQTKLKTIFLQTFKYALENDLVTKDYSKFLTIDTKKAPTKKTKYFSKEEVHSILNSLNFEVDYPTGKKSYTRINLTNTVVILLYTGLRITELLELKIEDINLKERIMNVHGTKTDEADRVVPLHKNIIPIIEQLIQDNQIYLFEIMPSTPIKDGTQYRKYFFEPYMNYLDLQHTPHATRHTFVSIMDTNGVSANSVVLKRIIGHANKTVTEIYTHKDITDLIEAIDKFKIK